MKTAKEYHRTKAPTVLPPALNARVNETTDQQLERELKPNKKTASLLFMSHNIGFQLQLRSVTGKRRQAPPPLGYRGDDSSVLACEGPSIFREQRPAVLMCGRSSSAPYVFYPGRVGQSGDRSQPTFPDEILRVPGRRPCNDCVGPRQSRADICSVNQLWRRQ